MHRSKTIAKTANTQTVEKSKTAKRKSICKKQNCEHLLAIHPIHVPKKEIISLAIYQVRCNQNKCTVRKQQK